MARWHSCNVLQQGSEGRKLWQFSTSGDKLSLQKEETKLSGEALPANVVGKDWQTLFKPKLNVAWLPPHHVFLRAVQIPKSNLAESRSMLELQLEKISPLPVAQVVWSFELLPTAGDLQTAIVVIVPRHDVEEFLGELEGQGYLPDCLELPALDQLHTTPVTEDGAWIFPGVGGDKNSCFVAWWTRGVLWNLSLTHLPSTPDCGRLLKEQLFQTAWAGELEGWLSGAPKFFLVADTATAEPWVLSFMGEASVQIVAPRPVPELAALTAKRSAGDLSPTNLLPPEYTARYKQQFIDRLWMRGLGAVLLLYLLGCAAYFGAVTFFNMRLDGVQSDVRQQGLTYTNILRLKEHVKVLQDQLDLQYSALESYKAVADFLPPELQLDSINFDRGRKLTLSGSAASDDVSRVQEFNESLMKVMSKNLPLFTKVTPPNISPKAGAGQISWIFPCELRRTDTE